VVVMNHERKKETIPVSPALSERVQSKARFIDYRWDFKTKESTNDLKPIEGSFWYVPDGGSDGLGCIQTCSSNTEILIDVPISTLPVVVDWRIACVLPSPTNGYIDSPGWVSYGPTALFHGCGIHLKLAARGTRSQWFEARDYVAERYFDTWRDGRRANISILRRMPDSRLTLVLRGGHMIDNLSIRSIRPDELPDAGEYLRAIERIPEEERIGTVVLPELKAAVPGKQMIVEFYPQGRKWGTSQSNPDRRASGAPVGAFDAPSLAE
jgi:hypothetical protein